MIVPLTLKCFKAYDIREKLGEELNEQLSIELVVLLRNQEMQKL